MNGVILLLILLGAKLKLHNLNLTFAADDIIVNKFEMMDLLKYLSAGNIIIKFRQIVFKPLSLIIE